MGSSTRELETLAAECRCQVLGAFGCNGYDTFSPFKLVGGIAKGPVQRGRPGTGP